MFPGPFRLLIGHSRTYSFEVDVEDVVEGIRRNFRRQDIGHGDSCVIAGKVDATKSLDTGLDHLPHGQVICDVGSVAHYHGLCVLRSHQVSGLFQACFRDVHKK